MKIAGTQFDRRRKLSDDQRKEIIELYNSGAYSQYALAKKFEVTPQAIRFIVNPDAKKKWIRARKKRGGEKQYYDTENQTKRIREYRAYIKRVEACVAKPGKLKK